jgi:hypothetical protein
MKGNRMTRRAIAALTLGLLPGTAIARKPKEKPFELMGVVIFFRISATSHRLFVPRNHGESVRKFHKRMEKTYRTFSESIIYELWAPITEDTDV